MDHGEAMVNGEATAHGMEMDSGRVEMISGKVAMV